MDYTVFAQSVARVRFLETKMLDSGKIEALVEARGFEDCIRMLQDSSYSDYVNMPSYEEGLKLALQDFYREMYKMSPISEVVDIIALRYDGHNLKCLLKGKLSGIDTSDITIDAGKIPVEKLKHMINEDDLKDMPEVLKECIGKALQTYENTKDPQDIDIIIDKGMYEYMLQVAEKSGLDYLTRITKVLIDTTNIKSFIRIKVQDRDRDFLQKVLIKGGTLDFDYYVNNLNDSLENFPNRIAHTDYHKWVKEGIAEYLKDGNLGVIERLGDNYIISYLWKAKLVSFGPEPLIAYMLAKENEIRQLRIILTGKKNGVHPDAIRERLRDVYV